MKLRFYWIWLSALVFAFQAIAESPAVSAAALSKISFDQKLGGQIPLEISFRNEAGQRIKLGEYFGGKPVILVLGYYGCPMLCTFVLNGLIGSLENIDEEVGKNFEVVYVSIDPMESPALAAVKKRTYVKRYGRSDNAQGWHFLTGDETAIRQLAAAVGFNYAYDEASRQYAHPSGLVILSGQGKISHYLSGVVYSPKELKDALKDASAGQTGSPIRQLFLLCFHYSPITGKYGPGIIFAVRVCGMGVFFALSSAIVIMLRKEGKQAAKKVSDSTPPEL